MEEKIFINSGNLQIEGLINKNSTDNGIVVTHPHPQYGGSMYNNVVDAIINAYSHKSYTTLRFNFRGTGASQGNFDNGIGEQEDIRTAISYLRDLGIENIDLAGYSFGSWINALAYSSGLNVNKMIMVSPPVGLLDFSSVDSMPNLKLVICGTLDEFAPPDLVKKIISQWNSDAKLEIINGADHFYFGYDEKIESILIEN